MRVIAPTKGRRLTHWAQMHWTRVETNVRRLQGRIYRAAANHEHRKGTNLQKLMVRSMSATLKAIRQGTQENNGKQTPGIDGVVCDTPQKRLELLHDGRRLKGYRPKPVQTVLYPQKPWGTKTFRHPYPEGSRDASARYTGLGTRRGEPLRSELLRIQTRTMHDGCAHGPPYVHEPQGREPVDTRGGHHGVF
jgi:hypothetical protein